MVAQVARRDVRERFFALGAQIGDEIAQIPRVGIEGVGAQAALDAQICEERIARRVKSVGKHCRQ